MQFIHRFSFTSNPELKRELLAIGFDVADNGFVAIEIDEGAERWPAVKAWAARREPFDLLMTKFTKKELADAAWLEWGADWHHGYPQPGEDVFGYRQATYDLSDWCEVCGIGMVQKAPFQMKGEPKWGNKGILQLNWVFGEYFVTPDVWTSVFKSRGIGSRPVLNRKGATLSTVVQLVIEERVGIVTDGLPAERCSKCGRLKYLPVVRGPFPALRERPSQAMARTREYFGSGGQADQLVVISQELSCALATAQIRGASGRPVSA